VAVRPVNQELTKGEVGRGLARVIGFVPPPPEAPEFRPVLRVQCPCNNLIVAHRHHLLKEVARTSSLELLPSERRDASDKTLSVTFREKWPSCRLSAPNTDHRQCCSHDERENLPHESNPLGYSASRPEIADAIGERFEVRRHRSLPFNSRSIWRSSI